MKHLAGIYRLKEKLLNKIYFNSTYLSRLRKEGKFYA